MDFRPSGNTALYPPPPPLPPPPPPLSIFTCSLYLSSSTLCSAVFLCSLTFTSSSLAALLLLLLVHCSKCISCFPFLTDSSLSPHSSNHSPLFLGPNQLRQPTLPCHCLRALLLVHKCGPRGSQRRNSWGDDLKWH